MRTARSHPPRRAREPLLSYQIQVMLLLGSHFLKHLFLEIPGGVFFLFFFFASHAFCLALSSCMGCDLPLGWYHVTVSLFSLTQPQSLLAIFASHALPLALLILPVLHLAILVGFSQILKILFRGTVVRQLWFPTPVTQHSGGWSRGLLSEMPVWG